MGTGNTGNRLTTKGLTGIKACDTRKQGNTRMNEVEESSWMEVGLDLVVLKHVDTGNTGNRLTTKGLTGIKACDIRKQGNTRMNEVE